MSVVHDALPAFGFDQALYTYGEPNTTATFKAQPEDFIVEEVLGFQPCGEGEHLFLFVQTDDHNTRYTQKCLAHLFGVSKNKVSYSGLKDRRGLTSQWFSIHLPGQNPQPEAAALAEKGITLLNHGRHNKKLRIGTHKTNRFLICLREVNEAQGLEQKITLLERGVPNYFGPQRFGHNGNNIAELQHWANAAELPQDRVERSRVLSTLRAWMFNGALAQRIHDQTWSHWQPGDPILLDGSQSYFEEPQWSETLQQRFEEGDIHLGGWLPGASLNEGMQIPGEFQALLELANMKPEPRALRLIPSHISFEQLENHIRVSFELPKGAYATSVLREWVKLNQNSPLE